MRDYTGQPSREASNESTNKPASEATNKPLSFLGQAVAPKRPRGNGRIGQTLAVARNALGCDLVGLGLFGPDTCLSCLSNQIIDLGRSQNGGLSKLRVFLGQHQWVQQEWYRASIPFRPWPKARVTSAVLKCGLELVKEILCTIGECCFEETSTRQIYGVGIPHLQPRKASWETNSSIRLSFHWKRLNQGALLNLACFIGQQSHIPSQQNP